MKKVIFNTALFFSVIMITFIGCDKESIIDEVAGEPCTESSEKYTSNLLSEGASVTYTMTKSPTDDNIFSWIHETDKVCPKFDVGGVYLIKIKTSDAAKIKLSFVRTTYNYKGQTYEFLTPTQQTVGDVYEYKYSFSNENLCEGCDAQTPFKFEQRIQATVDTSIKDPDTYIAHAVTYVQMQGYYTRAKN